MAFCSRSSSSARALASSSLTRCLFFSLYGWYDLWLGMSSVHTQKWQLTGAAVAWALDARLASGNVNVVELQGVRWVATAPI